MAGIKLMKFDKPKPKPIYKGFSLFEDTPKNKRVEILKELLV